MTDTTTPLRVIWRRDPCGTLASLQIWDGDPETGSLFLDTAAGCDPEGALDHLLGVARDYYRADPHHDTLPPDDAIVAAYWDHLA